MDAPSSASDAERELDDLRARAYGPHPDIQDDAVALARLTELEAAHITSPPVGTDAQIAAPAADADGARAADSAWTAASGDSLDPAVGVASVAGAAPVEPVAGSGKGSPPPFRDRVTAAATRRRVFVAGSLMALLAVAYTVAWLVGPHPDATLDEVPDESDRLALSLIAFLGGDADRSTLRGYQLLGKFQPWFHVDTQGMHCFMIVNRSNATVDGANCVPPGVDLFADIGAWPSFGDYLPEDLPNGSIIRFHYRGDSVHVFVYPASEGG